MARLNWVGIPGRPGARRVPEDGVPVGVEGDGYAEMLHETLDKHEVAVGIFPLVPRQLYLPVGVNQFCRFTSLAWPRCWAALVR